VKLGLLGSANVTLTQRRKDPLTRRKALHIHTLETAKGKG